MPKEPPPIHAGLWPDHAPDRCPVCGRGDCPQDPPPATIRADWIVLVFSVAVIAATFGWLFVAFGEGILDAMGTLPWTR